MILVCWFLTIVYSLKHLNPVTPNGWIMIDGHDYIGDLDEDIVCSRCGTVDKFVGYV